MDAEALISSVINNLSLGQRENAALLAKLSLADFMPLGIEIKTGDSLLLNINESGNLVLTAPQGEKVELPPQALMIDKNISLSPKDGQITIEAKAGQVQSGEVRLQITTINQQAPQAYLRGVENAIKSAPADVVSKAIIKDISNPQNMPLPTVKVAEVAMPFIKELPLTQPQQTEIQNAFQQLEIKLQVSSLPTETITSAPNQSTQSSITQPVEQIIQKIAENIRQLPDKIAFQPQEQAQIIQTSVQNLATELKNFIGTPIPAENNIVGFKTPLGIITPEIPVRLPETGLTELVVSEIILTQPHISEHSVSVSPLDKILATVEQLKTENPVMYQQIAAKLPTDNEKMLANMVSFTKAAVKGDIKQWLGQEIIQQLENQGETGKVVLNNLQSALQESSRQTPTWRIIEIPYYYENHMEKIKLAVKQYPDDENQEEDPHQKFGTRFVVDTNFTQLGAFQFDGFSFVKDRRFDLIIRTERYIEKDLCANIVRLFKTTLNDVQYTGNININLKENFIKISENTKEDKFLTQGLFI